MGKISNDETIEMFGLTSKQTQILFSTQKLIIQSDIQLCSKPEQKELKGKWLRNWEKSILDYLQIVSNGKIENLLDEKELIDNYKKEFNKSINKTWYYITILECLTFNPYTPLGNKENDKKYAKLKCKGKEVKEEIINFFVEQKYVSKEKIERLSKVYDKSINTISGKTKSLIIKILAVVGIAAICALIAVLGAPEIAVAIFGKSFEGLTGAALTAACLAAAGGGAIAAGGLGVAGGAAIIAGGGALLGLASGGTAIAVTSAIILQSPNYTLTQAAKLETILKEVVLNVQQDVVSAQTIIDKYKQQVAELNKKVTEMELDAEKTKKEIKLIKQSIEYMKKSCNDMAVFASCYEEGMKYTA